MIVEGHVKVSFPLYAMKYGTSDSGIAQIFYYMFYRNMAFHLSYLHEFLFTHFTGIRLLSSVYLHMFF